MMGAQNQHDNRNDRPPARLTVLLWLATALSVLQWSAPAVDPLLLARLNVGVSPPAGLVAGEPQAPATEARVPGSTIVFEKRSPGGRSLPSAGGTGLLAAGNPLADIAERVAIGTARPKDLQRNLAGPTFTARGPPIIG